MESKVVITGLGMITSVGEDLKTAWEAILRGTSGIGPITLFDASKLRTRFAAQVPDGALGRLSQGRIKKHMAKKMTRAVLMNFLASQMAVEDAGIDFSAFDRKRCGIFIGSTGTEPAPGEIAPVSQFDDSRIIKTMSNAYPAWLSLHYRLEGPSMTIGTACSSAGYAMAWGYDHLAFGRCDVVITGGASSPIIPELLTGFSDMMALSERNDAPKEASSPFDRRRDGFVMGEGAGILLMETEASAKRRGARIYAEVRRPALMSEGYNIISPKKDGEGMAACMQLALDQARLNREEVGYINAHGTSTLLNDLYETQAIKSVFGEHAYALAVSSSKSMIGHCLAASGGIEAVISCLALYEGRLPPTTNLHEPDPLLDLNYIPNHAIEKKVKAVLSNSFAFGGHNAVIPMVAYPS